MDAITSSGIAVIAANGNDGALGTYAQSTPGGVESAVGVGSVTNLKFPTVYNMKDSTGATFQVSLIPILNCCFFYGSSRAWELFQEQTSGQRECDSSRDGSQAPSSHRYFLSNDNANSLDSTLQYGR